MIQSPNLQAIPLDIVGSTVFGRYAKISNEQTWNMIISDDFLVPYAGYKKVTEIIDKGTGRGIFNSTRLGKLICVVDEGVYVVTANLTPNRIGTLDTENGDVYIDENDAEQIAICDRQNIYIYNYNLSTFQKVITDFIPTYVCFHNGYFISPVLNKPEWRLSEVNDGYTWPASGGFVGEFQTKPDNVKAVVRVPSKGNLIVVMGATVTEPWLDTGGTETNIFPYQKITSFNMDYGCLNAATIATSDKYIVWLGVNEKSGPIILVSDGGSIEPITTDGISFKFAQLKSPEDAYGFLFKQDGHLIYQLTFTTDNYSLAYDFNTQKFFNVSDENQNRHIAKEVVYFNNAYYFLSFTNGDLYDFNSNYVTLDGATCPRIRITKNHRDSDTSRKIINEVVFPIEEGTTEALQRVDLALSKDGGVNFGNFNGIDLKPLGRRRNIMRWWNLGMCNEFTCMFQFWGNGRFIVTNGVIRYFV